MTGLAITEDGSEKTSRYEYFLQATYVDSSTYIEDI